MKLKSVVLLLIVISICFTKQEANAQADLTEEIIKLDLSEAEAVLNRDVEALNRLWSDDFTVNSPRNEVAKGKASIQELIHNGVINYSSFLRTIESVNIHDGIAIVMGSEAVKPVGHAPGAGQTIQRRFTNIWLNKSGQWLLTARHANIICAK